MSFLRWSKAKIIVKYMGFKCSPCLAIQHATHATTKKPSLSSRSSDRFCNAYKCSQHDHRHRHRCQAGTEDTSGVFAHAVAARADGSVVLAGQSYGTFETALSSTDGGSDFAAVAIDENGKELWRWQVRTLVCVVWRKGIVQRQAF